MGEPIWHWGCAKHTVTMIWRQSEVKISKQTKLVRQFQQTALFPSPPPPPHEMLHTMKCYKRTNHLGNLTQLSFLKVKQPDLASSTTEHCVNLDVKIAEYCESCCI